MGKEESVRKGKAALTADQEKFRKDIEAADIREMQTARRWPRKK
jgi:hypothetical protein